MFIQVGRADEGMWLPLLMTEQNWDAMRARGFRMTPEDLYSINQASLKDAVVLFGRGCTGEIVSAEGLFLTNHHCGFGRIQSHSTVVNDYLKHGFWASSKQEELPNEGLTASVLVRMEDVTPLVEKALKPGMTETERENAIRKVSAEIVEEATMGNHYSAEVKPFFHGNQFILVITEVFRDVRLVGAPPSSIGKFGGDTDNWTWPRHTGDFAIFRIYADNENKPAAYSDTNVPYKPRKFFELSVKGVKEGDFTMVYGFPFQTEQYLPSHAINLYQNHTYPIIIKVRDRELEVINNAKATSDELRIMYAARQASVANGWKKFMGVIPGLQRFEVLDKKIAGESETLDLLEGNPEMLSYYQGILDGYSKAYSALQPAEIWNSYFTECFWKQPFFRFLFRAYWLPAYDMNSTEGQTRESRTIEEICNALPGFYNSADIATEKRLMAAMISMFIENLPDEQLPPALSRAKVRYADQGEFTDYLFSKSVYGSRHKAESFFTNWRGKSSLKKLTKDPLFNLMKEVVDHYRINWHPQIQSANRTIDSLHRLNMKLILDLNQSSMIYPDANATLRISYGQVSGSYPRDGVKYLHQTTLDGIFMKESMGIADYTVPERLREINNPELFGDYGINGTMPVGFIATNHTTGGNSGSPVLNADGHLIGINFDRAWEGTMSDLYFEPSICRNISIDIRYLLFIVDKYAEAQHLLEEMVIHR